MDHISTFSGQRINLQAEKTSELIVEIMLSDISLGLSRTARFNGQTTEFYSVAQHSCLVADSVPKRLRLPALLHDAAEFATGDIVSPLKAYFPQFKIIEHRIEEAIFAKFGIVISDYDRKIIKSADLRALATEKRDLMPNSTEQWEIIEGIVPFDDVIVPLEPKEALKQFRAYCSSLNLEF
mgnify:CR=1 FL=1|jgi:5'-deoxynucleotidase YfbR-like HD superfamily hydrolase